MGQWPLLGPGARPLPPTTILGASDQLDPCHPQPSWRPSASWTPDTHNHLRCLQPAGPLPPIAILRAFGQDPCHPQVSLGPLARPLPPITILGAFSQTPATHLQLSP